MRPGMEEQKLDAGTLDPTVLLRAELVAVEPSGAFAAGVRARVEARRGAPAIWFMRAAVVTAAVIVVGMAVVRWAGQSEPSPETAAPIAGVRPLAKPASPQPVVTVHRPGPARPARQRPTVDRVPERRLEVLVPPDQAIAVSRALAAYAAGLRVTLSSNRAAFDEPIGELPEPAPIQIAPVRIDRLGPGMVDFVQFVLGGIYK